MPRPVALDGDVGFETSPAHHPADTNATGEWRLVQSESVSDESIVANGRAVQVGATAVWSYVGGSTSSGPLEPIADRAELSPTPTQLRGEKGLGMLLDGEQATGAVEPGNRIVVSVREELILTN